MIPDTVQKNITRELEIIQWCTIFSASLIAEALNSTYTLKQFYGNASEYRHIVSEKETNFSAVPERIPLFICRATIGAPFAMG